MIDAIAKRRSARAIDPDRDVDVEVVDKVFDAARWAPSSSNMQPWRFVVFSSRDTDARDVARSWLVEGNAWALRAPVLVLVVATMNDDGSDNRFGQHDTGAATVLAALQAHEQGLLFHQMAGYDTVAASKYLSLPETVTAMAMIAIGWPGREDLLNEKDASREHAPRTRFELDVIVMDSSWTK